MDHLVPTGQSRISGWCCSRASVLCGSSKRPSVGAAQGQQQESPRLLLFRMSLSLKSAPASSRSRAGWQRGRMHKPEPRPGEIVGRHRHLFAVRKPHRPSGRRSRACWRRSCSRPASLKRARRTVCCQRMLPDLRSRQSSRRSCVSARAVTVKMRSPRRSARHGRTRARTVRQRSYWSHPVNRRAVPGWCRPPRGPRQPASFQHARNSAMRPRWQREGQAG